MEHRACALQGVVAIPWICMSIDFTATRLEEMGYSPKALNRRDFLRLGTLLAAIREKNVRITQPRFGSVNEIDPR